MIETLFAQKSVPIKRTFSMRFQNCKVLQTNKQTKINQNTHKFTYIHFPFTEECVGFGTGISTVIYHQYQNLAIGTKKNNFTNGVVINPTLR